MQYIRDLPPEYLELCPTIDQKYKVLFKLGSGRYSKVKMGLKLSNNQRVAIKIMNHKIQQNELQRGYQDNTLSMFLNEVKFCLQAKHKNIVQIIDFNVGGVYRTVDGKIYRIMYYVMKIAQNGQLFRLINQTEIFSEKTARYIFRQLIAGLRHLHKKGVAHCDIKAENILLDDKFNIKIADFGFARDFIHNKTKITFSSSDAVIGTTKSNAPELTNNPLQNSYHADEIDMFACGCLLFQLVMKSAPFKSSDLKDEYYNKLAGNEKSLFWDIFAGKCKPSGEFKDLIERCLNPNPKDRITLEQLYKHPWFTQQTISKEQYKKQIASRLKKVMLKVRKQQQSEIKRFFSKERSKQEELLKIEEFQLNLTKEFADKIREMKHLLTVKQASSCSSDSSGSGCDAKENGEAEYCAICPEIVLKNNSSCGGKDEERKGGCEDRL